MTRKSASGILATVLVVLCVACLLSCGEESTCPEGLFECDGKCTNLSSDESNCGRCGMVCDYGQCQAGECDGCTSDDDCDSGEVCRSGQCIQDPCESLRCTTHYCPTSGTFECSLLPTVYEVGICTCPVEGECELGRHIENCADPPDCVCENGNCTREPDCAYGVVCTGDDPLSCVCTEGPVECADTQQTCGEIESKMRDFHAANLACDSEFDCTTMHSYVVLVPHVCCFIYLSRNANSGIWRVLEYQLGWHDPTCVQFTTDNCCMAPPPNPLCIDGQCSWIP